MKKKLLSWFLIIAMMIAMLPAVTIPVSAGIVAVYVNGTNIVTDDDHTVACGAGTAVYDGASATLTLTDATVGTSYDIGDGNKYGIYSENALNIILVGSNTIVAEESGSNVSMGIRIKQNLTINGTGTLVATGGTASGSYGIYSSGNISISGGTVTATGGYAGNGSYGILCGGLAGITISGGTVTATGGTAANYSCGLNTSAGAITVTNGTVTATGGRAASGSYGFCGTDGISITGGLTTAQTMTAAADGTHKAMNVAPTASLAALTGAYDQTYAVYGDSGTYHVLESNATIDCAGTPTLPAGSTWDSGTKTLTLNNAVIQTDTSGRYAISLPDGSTIELTGTNVIYEAGGMGSEGIAAVYGDGDLTITGDGSLIAIGATYYFTSPNYINGRGIYTVGGLAIDGAEVTAIGNSSGTASYGIWCGGGSGLTIADDAAVTGIAGSTMGTMGNSYGVYTQTPLTVSGNGTSLTGIGGMTEGIESYGIFTNTSGSISGGIVTAIAGRANNHSRGYHSQLDTVVSDGMVTAVGGTASTANSYGMKSYRTLTFSGGKVTAISGIAANESAAVDADQGIVFSNGVGINVPTGGALGGINNSTVLPSGSSTPAAIVVLGAAPSTVATLTTASTVKGATVASLGTPADSIADINTAGSVVLSAAQASDTTNNSPYVTSFAKTESHGTTKVVKYASGGDTSNFSTDAAYDNGALSDGDFFIIKVTAQDTTTIKYYKIIVTGPSAAPGFTGTTAVKAAAYDQSVEYTLSLALSAGTLKVYDAASGGSALTEVTASVSGTALTLSRTEADLAEQDYWITFTETGKGESTRVQLTVAPAADVVLVDDETDLADIATDVNDGIDDYSGKTIKMTADITLTANPWIPIGIAFDNNPFCGTYDGNGHTISGLKIDATQINGGLFGATLNADIKNLTISAPTTSGSDSDDNQTGILVGHYRTDSGNHSIENVHVTGSGTLAGVYGVISYVDAFIGTTNVTVNNVSSTVGLSGDRGWIGGIIGYSGNSNGAALSITNCCTTGDVSSAWTYIGGLIGQVAASGTFTIDSCYTTGDVSGTEDGWVYVGGIVGEYSTNGSGTGKITNCYSMGDIQGDIGVGGIAGVVYMNGTSTGQIANVFTTGTVTASQYAGGIFGSAATAIDDTLIIDHAVALNKAIVNKTPGTNNELFCRVGYDDTNHGAIANSYAFKGMTVIDANTYVDDVTPTASAVTTGIDGWGIGKSDVNKASNWLTYLDVASGHTGYGKWTNGTHRLPHLTTLSSDDDFAMPDHLAYKALNSESAATRSYTAGNTTGIDVDSQIEVYGPAFSGAKVIINGYDAASDTVTWDLSGTGITIVQRGGQDVVVDGTTGTITFTGSDTAAHYQQVLRSVHFSTTATTGSRSISFSLGESAAYAGHYYEFVAFTAGTQKTWEQSKDAASRMEFGGQPGYLATILSSDENDFIASKLGANGWIGAKGVMNGSVKEWKWLTDPDPAISSAVFFTQEKDHTSLGYTSSTVMGTTADGAYANFNGGEPNGRKITPASDTATDTEWCGEIYSGGASAGRWNDLNNTGYASNADLSNPASLAAKGYVVEFSVVPAEFVVTKTVNIAAQSSGTGSGNGSSGAGATDGPIAQVNGQPTVSGTVNTTVSGNKTTTIVTVNPASLTNQLTQAGSGAVVTIPFTKPADTAVGELNGQMIKEMETKESLLVIKTPTASYTLPAAQIDIGAISSELGKDITLADIKVKVSISNPSDQIVQVVQQAANTNNLTLVVSAVNFDITCTYGEKTVNVSRFNTYVERRIVIPEGVDPSKITTGIVVSADGSTRHVPTQITEVDGVYYAVINSLTNSTYSVVWHPYEFGDVVNHWAKASINNMGSRMVVSGVGEDIYEPDRNMTRAEFAAIIVKALGLETGVGTKTFSDVRSSDWFEGYVKTAAEYGIITGYGNGSFRPMDAITREQAMTMIARAMGITKLESSLQPGEISTVLASYTDSGMISNYSENSIAQCIKAGVVSGRTKSTIEPNKNITRAEVAVIVERLLKKSGLID